MISKLLTNIKCETLNITKDPDTSATEILTNEDKINDGTVINNLYKSFTISILQFLTNLKD